MSPIPRNSENSEKSTAPSFFERKLWTPLLIQLKQGASPEKLTRSVSLGATISLFPILGSTTLLCFLAGVIFKLNPIAIQTVNYLLTPLQLIGIPIFIKAGEALFGLPAVSFNPTRLASEFMGAPIYFLSVYGRSALAGVFIWALFAYPSIFLIERAFLPLLKRRTAKKVSEKK